MADVETALMLRLEASLAKFEKQMARGQRVVNKFTKDWDEKFAASNRKMARNAEASAQTIGKEMDRLRAKYDPLFAASKRYETELSELNRAQKVGALNSQQYDAALERLNAEYARATGGAQRLAGANVRAAGATRGMGGGIQNVAYQIGDFATQVGAGTAASMALGQQLPQLLGGFGALGAILGAVVAIGVPLAANFFRSGEEAQTLSDRLETLQSAVDDYRSAVDQAIIPTSDLAAKYGTATEAARDFIAALKEIAQVDALQALDDNLNSFLGPLEDAAVATSEQLDGIYGKMLLLEKIMDDPNYAYSSGLASTTEEAVALLNNLKSLEEVFPLVEGLAGRFDIAMGAAEQLAVQMKLVDEATTLEAKLTAMQGFIALLDETIGPYSEMSDAQQEVYKWAQQSLDTLGQMVGAADGAANSIGGAASQAGRLADELARAVNNAINLAAQGISDVKRAKIEYEFRDDPVGRAGALARERFDSQVDLPDGADSTIVKTVEAERRAYVSAAIEAEEYRQSVIAWRKEQAEAARTSSSSGGSKGRSKREKGGIFEVSDKELQNIERQIEMIGKTKAEIAGLTAKYKLLDEAKERGLNLDARQAATGETLREQIDRQAASIGDLTEKYEQARERAAFFEGVQQDLKDGFIDAIVEGESLAGVLENLAKSLAKAALQAMLFNEGPFASGTGTGWLGGGGKGGLLGGAIIPGILHSGGTAGKDGYGHGRSVSPAVFKNAPRYHKGGIAGLRPNEVPAILERGERVIPNGQSLKSGSETFNIYVSGARGNSEIREMVAEGIQQARGGIVKQSVGSAQRSFKKSKSAWSP